MTVKQVSNLNLFLREAIENFLLDLEISNRSPGMIEN